MSNELSKVETGTGIRVLLNRWHEANESNASVDWDYLSGILHGGWVFADNEDLENELLMLSEIAELRSYGASK